MIGRLWWEAAHLLSFASSVVLWRLRGFGMGNVPSKGGVLLAANHQSYLDPVLVGSCLVRGTYFMARKSLFKNRFFGALIRSVHAFPVDRDGADLKAIREAVALLRDGKVLLVFPEGTRTRDGAIGRMKSGVGLLARRAGVPIIPVRIDGARRVWPKGRLFPRMGSVQVIFGRPFRAEDVPEAALGDRIRDAVMRLKGEAPGCRTGSL